MSRPDPAPTTMPYAMDSDSIMAATSPPPVPKTIPNPAPISLPLGGSPRAIRRSTNVPVRNPTRTHYSVSVRNGVTDSEGVFVKTSNRYIA